MTKITTNLSARKIQETINRLQSISNLTDENIKQATYDLMEETYNSLCDVFDDNNLSNHKSNLNKEITYDGYGFRIWTDDWVIIFSEYGTGVKGEGTHPNPKGYSYNHHIQTEQEEKMHLPEEYWIYYDDGSFHITNGQVAKHMFYDVEQMLNEHIKEFYSTAINLAINEKQYQAFKNSLR